MENSEPQSGKEFTKTAQIGEPRRVILTERTRFKSPKTECRDRTRNASLNASLRPLSLVYSFPEVFLDLIANSPCNRLSANHIEKLVEIQMEPIEVVGESGVTNNDLHIIGEGIQSVANEFGSRESMFGIFAKGTGEGIDAESLMDCGEFRLEKDFAFPFFIESFSEVQNGRGNGKELKNEFRVNAI